jgi:hypothetical protein
MPLYNIMLNWLLTRLLTVLFLLSVTTDGFLIDISSSLGNNDNNISTTRRSGRITVGIMMSPDVGMVEQMITIQPSSSIIVSAEEWRQYVSLGIVAAVIVDIVLGSPIANLALKPLRDAQEQLQQEEESNTKKASRSKERIDTDKVAQEAIVRAQNALELRNYLESRKTDWDRMEDLKRNLDRDLQTLDEDLRKRQQSLDERTKK